MDGVGGKGVEASSGVVTIGVGGQVKEVIQGVCGQVKEVIDGVGGKGVAVHGDIIDSDSTPANANRVNSVSSSTSQR